MLRIVVHFGKNKVEQTVGHDTDLRKDLGTFRCLYVVDGDHPRDLRISIRGDKDVLMTPFSDRKLLQWVHGDNHKPFDGRQ